MDVPSTAWITERIRVPAVVTEKQAIAKAQQVVKNWPADRLRGKNSAHRAKSATEFKRGKNGNQKRKISRRES